MTVGIRSTDLVNAFLGYIRTKSLRKFNISGIRFADILENIGQSLSKSCQSGAVERIPPVSKFDIDASALKYLKSQVFMTLLGQ